MTKSLMPELLEQIRQFGTCTVANAIEKFNVRLRNEGFTDSGMHSMFSHRPAMIGYAATGRVRSDMAPVATKPGATFLDRTDWWNHVLAIPSPRIVVLQDLDTHPGRGALWGEVHASIHLRLGCVGAVTNGAVRDLDRIDKSGFQLFAGSVSVSHAYVHFVDFGSPIQVAGLTVSNGDLLLADQHGVLSIPKEVAANIPAVAAEIEKQKRHIVDYCFSTPFSIDELKALVVGSAEDLHKIE
jgi:4-hydroxy-4-methyl-2-oxoglutarate aldolase